MLMMQFRLTANYGQECNENTGATDSIFKMAD